MPYVVAISPGHPAAAKKLTLNKYVAAEHLHVSSRKKGRGHADIALNAMGCKRFIRMRIQSYMVAAEIARNTDLLWTTPRILAERLGLTIHNVPFDIEPLRLQLFWNKNSDSDSANLWMREFIAKVVAEVRMG